MIQHFQVTYTNKLDKNIQFVQTRAGTVENTRKICQEYLYKKEPTIVRNSRNSE